MTVATQKTALIVAGGTGSRMLSDLPKQFLPLKGQPVLMRTLRNFHAYDPAVRLAVVMHPDYIGYWETLCRQHAFPLPHLLVAGGDTRYRSVKNGLEALPDDEGLVAVHDAVRALTPADVIARAFEAAAAKGSAVACVTLKDSIRLLRGEESESADRADYRLIQTPQVFGLKELKAAYASVPDGPELTDDASVWEKSGRKVFLVEGDYKNIKLTTPEDMDLAGLWG